MRKLILSLDGGGVKGAATSRFLSRVEDALKAKQTNLRDCVDFYAGTSTGGIIALALATTKMPVADIADLYNHDNATTIFEPNKGFLEVDGINAPKYEGSGKSGLLKEKLGNAKLKDVGPDKHVMAISYAIERRRPQIISSTEDEFLDLDTWQVADATSAAPTYFPTKELEIGGEDEEHWLVDGGVIANNPTMCAISAAMREWKGLAMNDLRVLSVGTGYNTRKINGPESRKWGALQWFVQGDIIGILQDERVVADQAITITGNGTYIRVNAELRTQPGLPDAPDDAMDDISKKNIKRLKELGDFWYEQYGESTVDLLMDDYKGPSLDHIDPTTGKPIVFE